MKETIIYEKFQNNLCSIKSIENDYSGRFFLFEILNFLIEKNGSMVVVAYRPYYDVTNLTNKLQLLKDDLLELNISKNLFKIKFHITKLNLNDEILKILLDIWFGYEQPLFIVIKENEKIDIVNEVLENKYFNWNKITNVLSAYVLFRSAEEDVLWVGKSSDLEFIELMLMNVKFIVPK